MNKKIIETGKVKNKINISPSRLRIKRNLEEFVKEYKDAKNERSTSQIFWNGFFAAFGLELKEYGTFEKSARRHKDKSLIFIDFLWKGVLLIEQKSADKKLEQADTQADDYYLALNEEERPKYILTSNFKQLHLRDMDIMKENRKISIAENRKKLKQKLSKEEKILIKLDKKEAEWTFPLSELPKKIELFGFMLMKEGTSLKKKDVNTNSKHNGKHDSLKEGGWQRSQTR